MSTKLCSSSGALLILFFVSVFLSGCAVPPAFVVKDARRLSRQHERIAILPYEVKYHGIRPVELTSEEEMIMLEQEAYALQTGLYQDFLSHATPRMRVQVLDPRIVNQRLLSAGLDLFRVGDIPVEDICAVLDVDAVIIGEILKHRESQSFNSSAGEGGQQGQRREWRSIWFENPEFGATVWLTLIDNQGRTIFSNHERFFGNRRTPVVVAARYANPRLLRQIPYIGFLPTPRNRYQNFGVW